MTSDGHVASRTAFLPHAVFATLLLFASLVVVGLAQMGGGASALPSLRTYVSGCSSSQSTSTSLTNVANRFGYSPTTATVTRTVTKTRTRTRTITRTTTSYRTRTRTLCQTTTVTEPGSTTTVTEQGSTVTYTTTAPGSTVTETTTAPGSTVTETTTAPGSTVTETTTAPGSTVTETVTKTVTPSAYGCPPADQLGFTLGESDETVDPIFCSYPAVPGEDPNDFYCTYSATTGALVTDNDAGLCQPSAVSKT